MGTLFRRVTLYYTKWFKGCIADHGNSSTHPQREFSHTPVYILLLFFHRKYDKMAEGGMKQNENFSD